MRTQNKSTHEYDRFFRFLFSRSLRNAVNKNKWFHFICFLLVAADVYGYGDQESFFFRSALRPSPQVAIIIILWKYKKAHTIEWLSSITSDYMYFRHIPSLPLDLFKWTRNQIILFTYFNIALNMYQNDVENASENRMKIHCKCTVNSIVSTKSTARLSTRNEVQFRWCIIPFFCPFENYYNFAADTWSISFHLQLRRVSTRFGTHMKCSWRIVLNVLRIASMLDTALMPNAIHITWDTIQALFHGERESWKAIVNNDEFPIGLDFVQSCRKLFASKSVETVHKNVMFPMWCDVFQP